MPSSQSYPACRPQVPSVMRFGAPRIPFFTQRCTCLSGLWWTLNRIRAWHSCPQPGTLLPTPLPIRGMSDISPLPALQGEHLSQFSSRARPRLKSWLCH